MPLRNRDAETLTFSERELKAIIQIIEPPFTKESTRTSFK